MTHPEQHPVVSMEQARDRAIDVLSNQFAHDAISLEELERRLELAYRASSVAELRALTSDLETAPESGSLPARAGAPVPAALAPDQESVTSIMTETTRRGVWAAPQRLDVTAVMSDTTIDLTQAVLPAGIVDIHIKVVCASFKLILPPGIRVANRVGGFMASIQVNPDDAPARPDLPVIRLSGWALMSEVQTKTRRLEEPGAGGRGPGPV
jgi:hypothetical protein